ncbi:MAG: S8 family serine peptidase [Egibacteraceae bacterium]
MTTRFAVRRAQTNGCAALCLLLLIGLIATPSAVAAAAPAPTRDGVPASPSSVSVDPDTLLVKLAGGTQRQNETTAARLESSGVELEGRVGATNWQLVRVPAGSAVRRQQAVAALPGVAEVSLNHIRSIAAVPNDSRWREQRYLRTLRLPEAWDRVRADAAVDIAVLDTGVDLDHPDLAGGLGRGFDVINGDNDPSDDHGHGTMVAGMAAARTNNGRGVAGAAWGARIMPVKVLSSAGKGSDAVVAEAIDWATDNGAEIINLSLGGPGYNPVLAQAVRRALARGVLVVAAAGNTGSRVDFYPAALPGVVAVGATDTAGRLTSFSTHGDWVDVAAPGWSVLSTGLTSGAGERYLAGSGTSFAAPLVSGVAALVRTRYPRMSPAQVLARLTSTARDVGAVGIDPYYGFGLVDAAAAVGGPRDASARPAEPPAPGEPNDLPSVATPLVARAALAELAPEGDVDWYAFQADEAEWVTASVMPPTAAADDGRALDAMIEVYDADLRLLAEADRTAANQVERVDAPLPQPGRYYVSIRNYHGSTSPGSYALSVRSATQQPALVGARKAAAWVVDSDPLPRASDVAVTAHLSVTMGRDLDKSSVGSATVRLLDGVNGRAVPSAVSYVAAGRRLVLDPATSLPPERPYVVVVEGVRDTTGVQMRAGFRAPFLTASGSVEAARTGLALTAARTLVNFPGRTTMKGRLSRTRGGALAGQPVELQARPVGGRFGSLARLTTDAAGVVAARVAPRARTSYRFVFPGDASLRAATSPAQVVRVRPALSAQGPGRVSRGRRIVVRGAARPARDGERIVLQRRVANRWRTVRRGRLSAASRYALATRAPRRPGRLTFRVLSPRDARHEQTARLVRVVVR